MIGGNRDLGMLQGTDHVAVGLTVHEGAYVVMYSASVQAVIRYGQEDRKTESVCLCSLRLERSRYICGNDIVADKDI